jgi:tryptophanyl-tRNA synthetase
MQKASSMHTNPTILTGIKPTGQPHIGNYFGAIKPALERAAEYENSFFFIADYHGLNSVQDPEEMRRLTRSIAATWLAAGLDPAKHHFYRQSDIPETFELETILNTFTPKGWMNKAHAYKATVANNQTAGRSDDHDVNMGLFTYPILMASDILLFDTSAVPVGKDQIQHVEIARDIAQKVNSFYNKDIFVLPEHVTHEGIAELPGIDGRKMSKSYNNVIPVFASVEEWQKAVRSIVTDAETHTPDSLKQTTFYKLYSAVATSENSETLVRDITSGAIGWKDAKDRLASALEVRFAEYTKEYERLMNSPEEIDRILHTGAETVRPIAQATLRRIKTTIGIL